MTWMDPKAETSQDEDSPSFNANVLAEQTSQLFAAHTR